MPLSAPAEIIGPQSCLMQTIASAASPASGANSEITHTHDAGAAPDSSQPATARHDYWQGDLHLR